MKEGKKWRKERERRENKLGKLAHTNMNPLEECRDCPTVPEARPLQGQHANEGRLRLTQPEFTFPSLPSPASVSH